MDAVHTNVDEDRGRDFIHSVLQGLQARDTLAIGDNRHEYFAFRRVCRLSWPLPLVSLTTERVRILAIEAIYVTLSDAVALATVLG